jgi:hypothetical protein
MQGFAFAGSLVLGAERCRRFKQPLLYGIIVIESGAAIAVLACRVRYPMSDLIPAPHTLLLFDQLWDAVRTCELNSKFHRKKAKEYGAQEQWLEISATLLGAIAGIGILSSIKGVPDSVWAVVAFFSGIVGQLRSVFRLPDKILEHRRL